MDSSLSESESSSNDEFLSHESIKSRETGLPNVYRATSTIEIAPDEDEEIVRIMNSSHEDELEEDEIRTIGVFVNDSESFIKK